MADQSVALLATNLYSSIQERSKIQAQSTTASVESAKDFQKSLKVEFNKFANMSPKEILNHIKASQNMSASIPNASSFNSNGIGTDVIKSLRSKLETQEKMTRKSLVNEASLIDVLTSTTEATNTVKTLVEVRNKFMEAYDKVMNMNL